MVSLRIYWLWEVIRWGVFRSQRGCVFYFHCGLAGRCSKVKVGLSRESVPPWCGGGAYAKNSADLSSFGHPPPPSSENMRHPPRAVDSMQTTRTDSGCCRIRDSGKKFKRHMIRKNARLSFGLPANSAMQELPLPATECDTFILLAGFQNARWSSPQPRMGA